MKIVKTLLLLLSIGVISAPIIWYFTAEERGGNSKTEVEIDENEPDLPSGARLSKEDYLRARIEHMDMLRGFDTAKQDSRARSIADMERSERALRARGDFAQATTWKPLGPAPIPVNASTSYSGRVSAIAVHPTNPNIVYLGTAQGGLYRSLNGGATWTTLMDNALTLAIGAVAISPSDPTTVFVGTGESTLCGSGCFIGVGLYRITNADTNPVLSGPLNKDASNNDVFTGRAVSEVIVHPTDPNVLFVSTTSGIAGIGSNTTGLPLPNAGIYRTTNAMSANPVFQKLTIQGTLSASRSVTDLAIEPDNPARLIAGVIGSGGDGGVYLSTNALDAVPTFTRTLTNGDGSSLGRTELAVNKANGVVTVYAAHGTGNGTLSKSVDGGATFTTAIANSFCGTQCFYDIAVAVDPVDPNKVYLGGSPNLVFGRSINGGTTFTSSSANLHVDTQAMALAPSNPNIMYFGSDGGVWKTTDVSATPITWSTLNNSTLSATQFMGISLHPTDRNYAIGGTQDNGTQFLAPDGLTWIRSDGGDGGFSVIDKESPNTTNTVAYHTYYNSSGSQIGFARATTTVPPGDPNWAGFYGCGGTANGINCADAVLFYAPMAGGPTPTGNVWNTLYFGTSRLYRSIDRGTTMTDVSGILPGSVRISAIAISPQNDDIRLVGTTGGTVFLSTTAGATSMTNVTGSIPARYVGRIAIDPTNSNVAYVGLNGFGLASGQHIWKTTNLLSGSPTWSPAGFGIPDTPVDSMAIDPANTQIIYAGTDIGVFQTSDGGANWIPFSNGLPRVAVFGMEIQPTYRVLKIATHGRGIWEYNLQQNRAPFDYDGDGRTDVSVYRPSSTVWYLNRSTQGFAAYQFGSAGDIVTPGDYTGDGKADVAVFRPSNGIWYVLRSEDLTFYGVGFGTNGDIPVPADYDGDGRTDQAVYRPSQGTWYLLGSTNGFSAAQFGIAEDLPSVGDFDGDGKSDIAVYRPSTGVWYRLNSSNGSFFAAQFGSSGDKIVPADYTGDGKTDIAVWRPSTGIWYVLRSEDLSFYGAAFGSPGDIPTPGDYDGDGRADFAVYRPTGGIWYEQQSTGGFNAVQFGLSGDTPTPSAYVR